MKLESKKLLTKYSETLPLRLIIQNIPYIGSSLDIVLTDSAGKWREQRIDLLLKDFDEKIKSISANNEQAIENIQSKVKSEDFYDLFVQSIQKSTATHNKEKIKRYSNLLKNYLTDNSFSSEEYLAEIFLDITETLTDREVLFFQHYRILILPYFILIEIKPLI